MSHVNVTLQHRLKFTKAASRILVTRSQAKGTGAAALVFIGYGASVVQDEKSVLEVDTADGGTTV